jgi:hypothetical protein
VYLSSFWGDGDWCEEKELPCRKICRDLANSSSGFGVGFEGVFENLVIRDELWGNLRRFYKNDFHKRESCIGMSRAVLVREEGDGRIPKDIELVTPGCRVYKSIGTLTGIKSRGVEGLYGFTPRVLEMVRMAFRYKWPKSRRGRGSLSSGLVYLLLI